VSDDLHGPQPFGVGQRRALAGCPAGTEKMDARVDLPAREPTHRRFVEAPGSSERADQRGADPGKWCSHLRSPLLRSIGAGGPESLLTPSTSFIVNQPCLPCIHFAAVSAPRANAVRSRAACESVIVSAGPSKQT